MTSTHYPGNPVAKFLCKLFSPLAAGLGVIPWLLFVASPGATDAVELKDIDGRHWLKLTAPGMVIISDASEATLRKWADEVEVFRRGIQQTLPIPGAAGVENTATIFLFRSEGALKPFLPLADGKPSRTSAFFNSVMGHNLGAVGLGGSRSAARERLYHELTHWFLQRAGGTLPLWLHEGLAQCYEGFTVDGKKLRLGHIRDWQFYHVKVAGTPALKPLLYTTEVDISKAGFKTGTMDLFYAESWALVHMLIFGTPGGMNSLPRYIGGLRRGLDPEEAFTNGFGLSLEAAHARLDDYVRMPRWWWLESPLDRRNLPEHTVTAISAEELDAQAALLLIGGGYNTLAQELVDRRLKQNDKNPFLWEMKAAMLLNPEGVPDDLAVRAIERAYEEGSRNPFICSLLGVACAEGRSSLAASIRPIELYRTALQARPGFLPAQEGIASLVLRMHEIPQEMRDEILSGLGSAPGSPLLNLAAAHIDILAGAGAKAKARLGRLLALRPDLPFDTRLQVHAMQESIDLPAPQPSTLLNGLKSDPSPRPGSN